MMEVRRIREEKERQKIIMKNMMVKLKLKLRKVNDLNPYFIICLIFDIVR